MKLFSSIKSTLFLVIIAYTLFSCKKSHTETTDPATILQGKNWKMVALTVSPPANGVTDVFDEFYDPCERDDFYQFSAGNILTWNIGAEKCYPTEPLTRMGTWSYDNSNKYLHLVINDQGSTFEMYYLITEINDNSFKAQISIPDNGINYVYSYTFQKI